LNSRWKKIVNLMCKASNEFQKCGGDVKGWKFPCVLLEVSLIG